MEQSGVKAALACVNVVAGPFLSVTFTCAALFIFFYFIAVSSF